MNQSELEVNTSSQMCGVFSYCFEEVVRSFKTNHSANQSKGDLSFNTRLNSLGLQPIPGDPKRQWHGGHIWMTKQRSVIQHGCYTIVFWISRDWLQTKNTALYYILLMKSKHASGVKIDLEHLCITWLSDMFLLEIV